MTLKTFLDYYKPLDSEEKIDKLFTLCFNGIHQPLCIADCSKILDVTNEDIRPYFLEKKEKYDNHIEQLKKEKKKRKKLKKKVAKGSRHSSSSVFNKDEIIYKRIHIISTPM